MQLELRADHDDRPAGVVDALPEEVLPEPALLALQQVGQRLQRPVARPCHRTPATAVVEQRVDGLLQHPLLVVDDDLGRTEVDQPLEAVVPVDDPAVEVVQVGGGEPTTVELDHRAQVRRDHRGAVQHHALRAVARRLEGGDDLQPLEGTQLLLPLAAADGLAQVLGLALDVEVAEQGLDGLRAHAAGEVVAVPVVELPVQQLVGDELLGLQLGEGLPDLVQAVQLTLRAVPELAHLALAALLDLAPDVALGALRLELGQVGLELLGPSLDVGVALLLDPLALHAELVLQRGQVVVAQLGVHRGDDVGGEVDDLLEILRRQVEQVPEPAGHTLEVPDVRHRGRELDVAHPLTPDLGAGDLHATALADDALEPDPLVLAAVALPVPGRAEDLLAEEAVLLGLERAVVDGLRLLDLAEGPLADVVSGGQANTKLVEEVDVQHVGSSPLIVGSGRDGLVGAAVGGEQRGSVHDVVDGGRLGP